MNNGTNETRAIFEILLSQDRILCITFLPPPHIVCNMHGSSSSSQHAQSTAHLSLTARSQPPIRQHMSPALSESRTPSDIMRLHKTAFNRINGNDRSRARVSTTKLKHMFVNNREREELMSACSIGDVDKGMCVALAYHLIGEANGIAVHDHPGTNSFIIK